MLESINAFLSDTEQPFVFVPGVDREVKHQPPFSVGPGSACKTTKMRAKCSSDYKAQASLKKSGKKQGYLQNNPSLVYTKGKGTYDSSAAITTEHILPPNFDTFLPSSQINIDSSSVKSQVCLKDLCPEDKRRIANLVQELARVSEEKEESVQRLKVEQESFERKIQQLEQQNLVIAEERGSLQQQYRECQELLGLYQQYLSQQQERLNQSIAQLSQQTTHNRVLISEEAPSRTATSRTNGSLFDGSYLSLAQPRGPQVHRSGGGGGRARKTASNHASFSAMTIPNSFSSESDCSPTEGAVKQHRIQKEGLSEPHSKSHHRCEHYQGSGYRAPEKSYNGALNQHECERPHCRNTVSSEAQEALTSPLLGNEDWEEKRHQLLLQKMQLEMERERLHARLAEQEERLHRQTQQLCQSRIDDNRFQQATQAELSNSITRNGDPPPEGLPPHHLTSSVHEDAEVDPVEHAMHEERSQTLPLQNGVHRESLEQNRKDMATSPAKFPYSVGKRNSVPVIHNTPEARLDFSVNELLEVFSPISVPKQCKHSTQRLKTPHSSRRPAQTAPKPFCRAPLYPAGPYPQSPQQDLEESQMLEDIFFIC
ncbi:hypothetical protein LDENG_00203830 [Lucifuga dentata]|nr:hypothetical protein LDENG_00203830 [Lucifuga dentata]